MQLRYYLRWFYWSGVAHAILGTDDPLAPEGGRRGVPGYYAANFLRASLLAANQMLWGRSAEAAEAAMDAAFSLGYFAQHKLHRRIRPKLSALVVLQLVLTLSSPTG
jgi:hypothetical protein